MDPDAINSQKSKYYSIFSDVQKTKSFSEFSNNTINWSFWSNFWTVQWDHAWGSLDITLKLSSGQQGRVSGHIVFGSLWSSGVLWVWRGYCNLEMELGFDPSCLWWIWALPPNSYVTSVESLDSSDLGYSYLSSMTVMNYPRMHNL